MITTSLKQPEDVLKRPPVFVFEPTLDNYRYAFEEADFPRFIKNTVIVAGLSTTLVITFGSLASYSFARYNPGDGSYPLLHSDHAHDARYRRRDPLLPDLPRYPAKHSLAKQCILAWISWAR